MEYTLKRLEKSRGIKMRLDAGGKLLVTAPKWGVSDRMIDEFVNKNNNWVERQRARIKLRSEANPSINFLRNEVSYLGKIFRITSHGLKTTSQTKVELRDGLMIVNPVTGEEKDIKPTLLSWLRREAEREITSRTVEWAKRMKTGFTSLKFGEQTSRWGSCSPDNGLSFNWRLIHFDYKVIEYVIIHELSHTIHHNHSNLFWTVVAEYCPDFKIHRAFLKRQMVEKSD